MNKTLTWFPIPDLVSHSCQGGVSRCFFIPSIEEHNILCLGNIKLEEQQIQVVGEPLGSQRPLFSH